MKKLLCIILLTATCPCFCALPPLWQSVREIEAILESEELGKHFEAHAPIIEISKIGNGYLIRTEKQEVVVEVRYLPGKMMGPTNFELKFNGSNGL